MKKEFLFIVALLAGFMPAGANAQSRSQVNSETPQTDVKGDELVNGLLDILNEPASVTLNDSLGYTYSSFEKMVLDYSQTLKQSESKKVAMKKAMQVAKTSFLPSVDATGNYQYRINDYDLSMGEIAVPMKHDSYSAGFSVMQPIYTGGSVYYNYKGQKIQSAIADQGFELTKDNIIFAAENSYWGASAQKEMYRVMCRFSDIVGHLLSVLQDRYHDGMISKTDLIQMEVRKKEAEMQRLNAWESYKLATQNMNVLMGKNPMDSVDVVEPISKETGETSLANTETVMNIRPDLAISKLSVDFQKTQMKLATSKYNPSLSVGYQGTWGTQMININGDTQFNSTLMVSLKVPIFRWGARFKQTAAQKALLNQSRYAYQDKQDQISKELASTWTKLEESKKRIDIAEKNCKLADENLELNTFSYQEGKLSILDVLSAQLTWIQAYTNLVQSHYQQKIALADYKKASGARYMK